MELRVLAIFLAVVSGVSMLELSGLPEVLSPRSTRLSAANVGKSARTAGVIEKF